MSAFLPALLSRFKPDERFITHRYRSTRLALIVGVALMGAWFEYQLLVNDVLRVDLLVILGATTIAKLGAMVYLRRTQ